MPWCRPGIDSSLTVRMTARMLARGLLLLTCAHFAIATARSLVQDVEEPLSIPDLTPAPKKA